MTESLPRVKKSDTVDKPRPAAGSLVTDVTEVTEAGALTDAPGGATLAGAAKSGAVQPRRTTGEVMQLQRLIGNRATAQLLRGQSSKTALHASAERVSREADGEEPKRDEQQQDAASSLITKLSAAADPPLQRNPERERQQQITTIAGQLVGELPPAPENIPSESETAERVSAGKKAGEEIGALVAGKPNLAEVIMPLIAGESGGDESAPASGPVPEAPASVSGAGSSEGSAGGAAAGSSTAASSEPAGAIQRNPDATQARGNLDSTSTGNTAKSVTSAVKFVLDKGSAVGSAVIGAAGIARELMRVIGATVGLFFNAITGIFDLRAAISSRKKFKNLKQIAKDARDSGHDPAVVAAVEYAMQQKYEKAIKRAIAFVGAAVGAGVSIAILAGAGAVALMSNPVGWGILTILTAGVVVIGVGLFIYRLFRKIWKAYNGTLGEKRRDIAIALYQKGIVDKDPVALKALVELGVNTAEMIASLAVGDTPIDSDIPGLEADIREQELKIAEINELIKREKWQLSRSTDRRFIARHRDAIESLTKRRDKHEAKITAIETKIDQKRAALLAKKNADDAHKKKVLDDIAANKARQLGKLAAVKRELAAEERAQKRTSSADAAALHDGRIAYLKGRVAHYEAKIAAIDKQLAWKGMTKAARNDIKQIERKLKST